MALAPLITSQRSLFGQTLKVDIVCALIPDQQHATCILHIIAHRMLRNKKNKILFTHVHLLHYLTFILTEKKCILKIKRQKNNVDYCHHFNHGAYSL
jgi:ketol-acid reductoisomerase